MKWYIFYHIVTGGQILWTGSPCRHPIFLPWDRFTICALAVLLLLFFLLTAISPPDNLFDQLLQMVFPLLWCSIWIVFLLRTLNRSHIRYYITTKRVIREFRFGKRTFRKSVYYHKMKHKAHCYIHQSPMGTVYVNWHCRWAFMDTSLTGFAPRFMSDRDRSYLSLYFIEDCAAICNLINQQIEHLTSKKA